MNEPLRPLLSRTRLVSPTFEETCQSDFLPLLLNA
jgi:hypothetical protein